MNIQKHFKINIKERKKIINFHKKELENGIAQCLEKNILHPNIKLVSLDGLG